MKKHLTLTDYDTNASRYDQIRRPNSIIIEEMRNKFQGSSRPVLSLGCGTGRLEFELSDHFQVIGIDRSSGMLSQAKRRLKKLVQGDMAALPFPDAAFSGVYFMQSLHHIGANMKISDKERTNARLQVLTEALRTMRSGPIVIVQRDPSQNQAVWFWKYFPQALEIKLRIQPDVSMVAKWLADLKLKDIRAIPIHDQMGRGFFDPESPLDPIFRQSFSDFSYLTQREIEQGLIKLNQAINDGSVHQVIEACKKRFQQIGGTVFLISAQKTS
jgi:ubiquinone/menaquinone biosynthesis C-methylase UbiE